MALAAESGRFEVVKWLLSQGADVMSTRRGLNAAQWALYRGNSDVAEFIIGYGGMPDLNHRQTVCIALDWIGLDVVVVVVMVLW